MATSRNESYATIASLPASITPVQAPSSDVRDEIHAIFTLLQQCQKTIPEELLRNIEHIRPELEPFQGSGGFRTGVDKSQGVRSFGGQKEAVGNSWRGGRFSNTSMSPSNSFYNNESPKNSPKPGDKDDGFRGSSSKVGTQRHSMGSPMGSPMGRNNSKGSFYANDESTSSGSLSTSTPRTPVGRYQSKFTTEGNLDHKILNTVIGNKLNAFTPLTYNDTRDFIYQIMDSGETEFSKDFVEKVFQKATQEEIYCALFAKLIAEIAHRYPVMYTEMRKYHSQFLEIFDNVQEDSTAEYNVLLRQKQYRMGYGQFLSELACLNTLEKTDLFAMVERCMARIWFLTSEPSKEKVVEEFVDCLVRLTKALKQKSPKFFGEVKQELGSRILEKANALLSKKAGDRPSLTPKAHFGLLDLTELILPPL